MTRSLPVAGGTRVFPGPGPEPQALCLDGEGKGEEGAAGG